VRSLRGRLTIGLTLVLAFVLAVAGVLAARDVERAEREALDDRLMRTAELSKATALDAVQNELPSGDNRLKAVLSATRTSLRLTLGRVALISTGDPFPATTRLPRGLSTFTSGGVRYRAYVTRLRDRSLGGLARLELTTRLTSLEDRQSRLERTLALLGAAALAVCALLVFVMSGVLLRPLRRLRRATAEIAGERDLDRRVADDSGPQETRELATSFNAMLARLSRSAAEREQAIDATRRFAADAGHELRTPLTAIEARLSALARHPDQPEEKRARMAAEALEQQHRLVALLDGLQALARGDAAPATERVDLGDVADAALASARDRHPSVAWIADVPDAAVPISAWEPGLRSLIDNLLENAVRHGRPGGSVSVSLRNGPVTELVVEDDGPGIPESERDRIFDPFVRLSTDSEGSGLGLALVAQQARHHGATVAVDRSEKLGGARFAVRFAGAGAAAPSPPPTRA
jgi:signal transduction histidine kinase